MSAPPSMKVFALLSYGSRKGYDAASCALKIITLAAYIKKQLKVRFVLYSMRSFLSVWDFITETN